MFTLTFEGEESANENDSRKVSDLIKTGLKSLDARGSGGVVVGIKIVIVIFN